MIAKRETCASNDKSVCDFNEFRRLRYFHGMLLNDNDFQAEQEYHAGKRRMLNRMLHGSGVVCGLDIKGKKDGRWIEVTSGLALDCSGNEIWMPQSERVDLTALLPPKDTGEKPPDCKKDDAQGDVKSYYIGIRYEEKPSNPVSIYLPSGNCDERTCENSRYKEGFCIEVVDCCPEKHDDGFLKRFCECHDKFEPNPDKPLMCRNCGDLKGKDLCHCHLLEEFCEQSVPCPECCSCEKPCHVILGKIEVNKERLVSLCMNDCREYVITGRMFQHMLIGVVAGGEEYFQMKLKDQKIPLPELGELAHNPIKALCWFLRYKLIEGGKFEVNVCDVKDQTTPGQDVSVQLSAMRAELETVKQQNASMAVELNKVIAGNKVLLEPEEKQPTVEKQPVVEKQSATKPPKTPAK